MEARKWEELPIEVLVDVFGRVELQSLVEDVPLVCKSWYKASFNPFCWKELDFPVNLKRPEDEVEWKPFSLEELMQASFNFFSNRHQEKTYATKFLKLVVDRSGGCATMVKLPSSYTDEALTYLADKCPALKKLKLLQRKIDFGSMMPILPSVISKLKKLESLEIQCVTMFKEIVTEIGAHCENFVALSLVSDGIFELRIGEEEAMSVVTCLPKIKCLALTYVVLDRENLIKILKGCTQLVNLDVRGCCGFDEDDEELLKLASHIPTFECSGSSIVDPFADNDAFDDIFHDFPINYSDC